MDAEDFYINLIEAVRQEEVIYCKSNPLYMDRTAKRKAWERISVKLGKGVDECEKRWVLLREKYGREMRKQNLASGSAASQETPWPYFYTMDFLKMHIKRRQTKDNASKTSVANVLTEVRPEPIPSCSDNIVISQSSVSSIEESPSPSTSITPAQKKQKRLQSASDREVADSFQNVLKAYERRFQKDESEDELFFKAGLKMMEPLPIKRRDFIKKQFMDLVLLERAKHDLS